MWLFEFLYFDAIEIVKFSLKVGVFYFNFENDAGECDHIFFFDGIILCSMNIVLHPYLANYYMNNLIFSSWHNWACCNGCLHIRSFLEKTFKISILKQIQNKNFNADQDMELFVQLKLSSHNMGVGCIPKPRDLDQLWYWCCFLKRQWIGSHPVFYKSNIWRRMQQVWGDKNV